jgi:type I site-specific restriction-modification system R (restriction) subunit
MVRDKNKQAEYNREYYKNHKNEYKKKHKEYYEKHKDEINRKTRKWRMDNPDRKRDIDREYKRKNDYSRKYGITKMDYETMYLKQEGKCLICKKEVPHLSIDHDHKTGKVRGLLCGSCNSMLGHAHDNIDSLKNAITYLETS